MGDGILMFFQGRSCDCTAFLLFNMDLDLIRALIPYVRPIRDNNPNFPVGFCDVTTAQIMSYMGPQKLGVRHRCGNMNYLDHVWVHVGILNIDFTAHQFPLLRSQVRDVDGFQVLYGSDDYFKSLGYTFFPSEGCAHQLLDTANLISSGVFGNSKVSQRARA